MGATRESGGAGTTQNESTMSSGNSDGVRYGTGWGGAARLTPSPRMGSDASRAVSPSTSSQIVCSAESCA